jgi:tRNA (guanine-N7-)-methyltransferase
VYVKCTQESEDKQVAIDFNFIDVKYTQRIEDRLPKKALVFDGYFIHFERVYKISEQSLLIKCAFGSFDRPEHKYILLEENACRYFVSAPVKTTVNFHAHQKIGEQLMLTKGVEHV